MHRKTVLTTSIALGLLVAGCSTTPPRVEALGEARMTIDTIDDHRLAETVRTALLDRGIDADRLESIGLGESYPIATNDTVAGRQENRRVEIVISNPDGDFPAAAIRDVAVR